VQDNPVYWLIPLVDKSKSGRGTTLKEEQFYERVDQMVMWLMERMPVVATFMGLHTWDDRLQDLGLAALEELNGELRLRRQELEALDTAEFSLEAQIDHEVMIQQVKNALREYEKVQGHLRNPNTYLQEALGGVFLLLAKDFAPLIDRLRNAMARAREVPRVLQQGKDNLQPEAVPRLWCELAIQQGRGGLALFTQLLPALVRQTPELQDEVEEAARAAAGAIEQFVQFLQDEVLPRCRGDFAAGTELFNELLREDHMVDYDADQLLNTGWRLFNETKAQMEDLAREIDSRKTVHELLEEAKADHPSADQLLDTYRQSMGASRRFVVEHDIAGIPEDENLRIIETPAFLRATMPYAAYMSPGIFEDQLEGLFFVTPVDPSAPLDIQEEKLKGHYRAKLPVTTLHEGYPGHHLQLIWAVTHGSTARKLSGNNLFIEGWAFYCEELMERLGYISEPVQRLGRLSDQLWRAARIILDVSLHCKGMSVEEAVDFLVEKAGLERSNALAEVSRYTSTPTQPQSYLMGKLEILKIVEEYQKCYPQASMRQMHDSILACGSLPPRLMKMQLFGE